MSEQNELAMTARKRVGGVRAKHKAAYQRRMGLVSILQSCICLWGVEFENTATGHSVHCPSHEMLIARKERGRHG